MKRLRCTTLAALLAAAAAAAFVPAIAAAQEGGAPAVGEEPADGPAPADSEELSEADAKERAEFLAKISEMLDGDAKARFEGLSDEELAGLIERAQQGESLDEQEQAIAAAVGAVFQEKLAAGLTFQTGDVTLGASLATLRLGEEMRFLGPADAQTVLVDMWGNPPGLEPLGMLFPPGMSPADDDSWGVIITYSNDGHVDDDDADDIDYDELLADMQSDTKANNQAREAQGYGTVELIGWAEPPHYNRSFHNLYWAKELDFSDAPGRTLNYSIRVLGREGVLELNAVSSMEQLPTIKPEMEKVLTMVSFNEGHRYEDFDSSTDRVAAYGVGGLVAGKVLAKAGFFAAILKFLVAAKKLVLVGIIALFAGLGSLFRRRRESADGGYDHAD